MRIKKLNKYVWFIGLLALSVTMVVIGIRCSSKSSTNSSTNNSGGVPSATSLTISGVLQQGSVVISATTYSEGKLQTADIPLSSSNLSPLSATPLSGYKLYCVTFANPPAAGTGIADASGNVAVTFSATSTPFGCFILDPSNNGVATLFFTNTTNGQKGQTVSFSGDTNLGTITVDTTSGVALATLPSNGSLVTTTPSGLPCPVGEWKSDMATFPNGCAGYLELRASQSPDGSFLASLSNVGGCQPDYNSNVCGTCSWSNVPVTYSNKTMSLAAISPCPSDPSLFATIYFTGTTDAACSTINGTAEEVPNDPCDPNSGIRPTQFILHKQ